MATAQPISLYLDLYEGRAVSIETVARTSLAFSATIRRVAEHIDPSIEIEIDFISGTEGSLWLNSAIRRIHEAHKNPTDLKSVAIICATWFAVLSTGVITTYEVDRFWKSIREDVETNSNVELTEEQFDELKQFTMEAIEAQVGRDEVRKVVIELENDSSVRAVGIGSKPGKKPKHLVARERFRDFTAVDTEVDVPKREERRRETVVLVSPVLVESRRKWELRSEFAPKPIRATIADTEFLHGVLTGEISVPMVSGIHLDVDMVIDKEVKDGIWTTKSYTVERVHKIDRPAQQQPLL